MAIILKNEKGQCAVVSESVYRCPLERTALVSGVVTNRSLSAVKVEILFEDVLVAPHELTLDPGDSFPICEHTLEADEHVYMKAGEALMVDYKLDILERT